MVDVLVSVQPDHIRRLMRLTQPVHSVIELIWNGLDADADNVDIVLERNNMGGVIAVTVSDDGTGIPASRCESAFKNLGGSWKLGVLKTAEKHRPIHGRSGQGRFRAFALGNRVQWTTVSDDIGGRFESTIVSHASTPEKFEINKVGPADKSRGTRVEATGSAAPLSGLATKKARARLTREFARHLLRFKDIDITYDGASLNPRDIIERSTEYEIDPGETFEAPLPKLEIIEWKSDFPRELILCNADGFAITDIRPGVHAPQFSFAAYLTWAEFDQSNANLADLGHERSEPVVEAAREQLRKHFKARSSERLKEVVEAWKAEQVYPFPEGPTTKLEKAKRDLFDVVAVQALPGISSENRAKKLSLRLIREALEHAPSSLKTVLSDVLDLSDEELDDLAGLLDRTSLGSVISSAKLVSERLDFLRSLELLLFDEELKKDVLERSQLHRMLAAEPWIFGEQFSLSVDDQSIKEVLRRHLKHLGRKKLNLADVRLEDRSTAIVDLMLSKTIQDTEKQHHLIVELKRPTTTIGYKERQQIEAYAMAVAEDQRFRGAGTKWDFVLVANQVSRDISRLSNKRNQPAGLIHEDVDLDLKIWIRHWGSIIEERRRGLHFFKEKLEIDPSKGEALDFLRRKHAQFLPPTIGGPNSAAS